MRPNRHSGEQIIAILKEQQAAANTIAFSDVGLQWMAKSDGLEAMQAKRLQALEDENSKLKKLLAEAIFMIDNLMLKDVAAQDGNAQPVLPISGQRPARPATLRLSSSALAAHFIERHSADEA